MLFTSFEFNCNHIECLDLQSIFEVVILISLNYYDLAVSELFKLYNQKSK